jgi:uncharacterized membrane protein YvbJ
MRRETIVPLITGLIIGILLVVFFDFNSRLNSNTVLLNQIEQASESNTKNINDVITFINGAQKGNSASGTNANANAASGTETTK